MTATEVFNWILVVVGIGVLYYYIKNQNTIYIGVRDKKNKIHKVPVYATDTEKEVMKKVEKYMQKLGQ